MKTHTIHNGLQGDVLVQRIEHLPAGAQPISRTARGWILAEGEVTGHAHTIAEEKVQMYTLDEILYFVAQEEAVLTHEEHGSHTFAPGTYRVMRKREWNYTDQEARRVMD